MPHPRSVDALLAQVRACTLCAPHLPLGPRPVLQWHPDARILIAGQAPLLAGLQRVQLTLLLGQYAQAWHLPAPPGEVPQSVTGLVQGWHERLLGPGPQVLPRD